MSRVTIIHIVLIILTYSVSGTSQVKKEEVDENKIVRKKITDKCLDNPDKLYDRQQILENFVDILSSSIPEYKYLFSEGFSTKIKKGNGFFVYDLTDTSNKRTSSSDCVNFLNNHVYHLAPLYLPFSFSHIVVLDDGNLKVFKSVNCKSRGDSLEDVLRFLNQKLKDSKEKDAIIERVKNYRTYGKYYTIDETELRCQEIANSNND